MALDKYEVHYQLKSEPNRVRNFDVLTSSEETAIEYLRQQHPRDTIVLRYVRLIPPPVYVTRTCGFCFQSRQVAQVEPREVHPAWFDENRHMWREFPPYIKEVAHG